MTLTLAGMLKKPRLRLTETSWRRMATKIPDIRRCNGVGDQAARRCVEAVLWIWRTGAPWRDVPPYFGKGFTAYKRFRRWTLARAWQVVHASLPRTRGAPADTLSIDSSSVRVHQHAAGGRGGPRRNAIGRSRGGRTTKIHAAVAGDKALHAQILTGGERADITQAVALIKRASRQGRPRCVIAERAYDADAFVAWLTAQSIQAVIPPRKHRKQSRTWARSAYRRRNGVERFYLHAKQFRRLSTRFDKTVTSYRAGVILVSAFYLAI